MGKKDSTGEALGAEKKVRIRWPFPRATLEEALKIPVAIKEKNGGNPWQPEEVRQAIGGWHGRQRILLSYCCFSRLRANYRYEYR